MSLLDDTLAAVAPADAGAMAQARERQERLTKPSGSLGALEELSVRLAGPVSYTHLTLPTILLV